MGTNYYLHRNTCEHCHRGDEPMHIGKSSGGWCFSLHIGGEYDDETPMTLGGWQHIWDAPGCVIKDENGEIVTPEAMLANITDRAWGKSLAEQFSDPDGFAARMYGTIEEFYRKNHAEPGPRNLSRHALGAHCSEHGEGTWDCIPGDFS